MTKNALGVANGTNAAASNQGLALSGPRAGPTIASSFPTHANRQLVYASLLYLVCDALTPFRNLADLVRIVGDFVSNVVADAGDDADTC